MYDITAAQHSTLISSLWLQVLLHAQRLALANLAATRQRHASTWVWAAVPIGTFRGAEYKRSPLGILKGPLRNCL